MGERSADYHWLRACIVAFPEDGLHMWGERSRLAETMSEIGTTFLLETGSRGLRPFQLYIL
jgi:hypothetical protein